MKTVKWNFDNESAKKSFPSKCNGTLNTDNNLFLSTKAVLEFKIRTKTRLQIIFLHFIFTNVTATLFLVLVLKSFFYYNNF